MVSAPSCRVMACQCGCESNPPRYESAARAPAATPPAAHRSAAASRRRGLSRTLARPLSCAITTDRRSPMSISRTSRGGDRRLSCLRAMRREGLRRISRSCRGFCASRSEAHASPRNRSGGLPVLPQSLPHQPHNLRRIWYLGLGAHQWLTIIRL